MKRFLFALILLLFATQVNATHQKAAEITYTHVSGNTYKFTITSYTFMGTIVDRDTLNINWGDGTTSKLPRSAKYIVTEAAQTFLNFYEGQHTYAGAGTYIISMTDESRNGGVTNVPNSIETAMYVQTMLVISPLFSGGNDNPVLTSRPIDRACLGQVFIHNPGAFDPDGDSLSYKLVACKGVEGMDIPGYSFPVASTSFSINENTGDVIWDAPVVQGEYNIAILVEEWRRGRKIGEVTRDMQITAQQCDNRKPVLRVQNACVIAGNTLTVPIYATDPDSNNTIKITASGELFLLDTLYPFLLPESDTSVIFSWRVPYSAARAMPYIVYCKATDNGTPPLSDLKNFTVNVALPAVTLYPIDTTLLLRWQRTPAPQVVGYNIYRARGSSTPLQDSCVGGLNDSLYTLIATVQDTFYREISSGLTNGMNYCYRVTTVLNDMSESLFSNEECIVVQKEGVPIITHTSIEQTDRTNGVVMLRWQTLSPYANNDFELYKVANDTAILIARIAYDTVVVFYDSNVNTQEYSQRYMVVFDTVSTDISTTLRLEAFGYSRRVVLRWNDNQLWSNRYYRIYKDGVQIARTTDIFFVDTNVINDSTYSYYVEGEGSYFNSQLPEPLLNKSNAVSAIPRVQPPCTPELTSVTGSCEPFQNKLTWSVRGCDEDIVQYDIYFAGYGDTNFEWLQTVPAIFSDGQHVTIDIDIEDYEQVCYSVTATNIKDEESPLSNTICVDNRVCFTIILPNVFTPNGDGCNDVFPRSSNPDYNKCPPNQDLPRRNINSLNILDFEIQIFDRWGKLVYKTNKFPFEWNGCYMNSNNACPDGAYFYIMEYSLPDSKTPRVQNGSVVILR
jgi:gliding motility-associated-like protein